MTHLPLRAVMRLLSKLLEDSRPIAKVEKFIEEDAYRARWIELLGQDFADSVEHSGIPSYGPAMLLSHNNRQWPSLDSAYLELCGVGTHKGEIQVLYFDSDYRSITKWFPDTEEGYDQALEIFMSSKDIPPPEFK